MSDEQKTYDPKGRRSKNVGIAGAIEKFKDEMPPGTVALNLGCGQSRMDGFVNVDWMPDEAVDVACDLFAPNWPIADGSVGFVYMSHLLEHVPGAVWPVFWNEMWRVCADEARVMIMSPHARSDRFIQDPTHCQPLIDAKFMYLSKSWREANKLNHNYYGGKDLNFLQDIRPWRMWHQDYAMRADDVRTSAMMHENNVIDDCIWFLKAFKTEAGQEAYVRRIEAQMNGQDVQGQPIEVRHGQ